MGFHSNNNKEIVNQLAVSSIRNSRMRNVFIIFPIALSVCLLMVISLYTVGLEESKKREVADMQHVIYEQVTEDQIESLMKEDRVELLKLQKHGQGIEIGNKMIQPIWYGKDALIGDNSEIGSVTFRKGNFPEAMNEIAVSNGFCELMGKPAEPGTIISLTFLDGYTEEFVISGILDMTDQTKVYPILFSESYAREGTQLKNVMYDALVRICNAEQMSQSEFLKEIRDIAAKSGMKRKQVNENNYFLDTLSGGERQSQQITILIGLGIGILFVSVLVIYSVFYLAVAGRIRQFGQLRTIGMTKKQIKGMITREGLLLSMIGIPVGLLIGGAIGYLLQKNGWNWKNTFIIAGIIIVADVLFVLISIHKPAKIAASISPIEAAKYSVYQEKKGKPTTRQLERSLSPISLAEMNAARNRKRTVLTTISLGVGGVLFMIATAFISSTNLEDYARQSGFRFGEFIIGLSYNAVATAEHGVTDIQIDNPLNEELIERIKAIDGVKKITSFNGTDIRWEAHGEMQPDTITGFSRGEITDELLEAGTLDYDKMIENNQILINGNSVIEEVFGWKYEIGDIVKITLYNGTEEVEKEFIVAGFVNRHKYFIRNPEAGIYLVPEDTLNTIMNNMNLTTKLIVSTDEAKQEQIETELQQIVSESSILTMDTFREQKQLNEASFALLFGAILGISIFIIGFSLINMINTLITGIVTRKQEFAMLQSIGMSNRQLKIMIQTEGLLLSLSNLIITLIIGTSLSYVVVELLRNVGADYMHYTFPKWYLIGYIITIIIVPVLVSSVTLHSFHKQTLVERLAIVD